MAADAALAIIAAAAAAVAAIAAALSFATAIASLHQSKSAHFLKNKKFVNFYFVHITAVLHNLSCKNSLFLENKNQKKFINVIEKNIESISRFRATLKVMILLFLLTSFIFQVCIAKVCPYETQKYT